MFLHFVTMYDHFTLIKSHFARDICTKRKLVVSHVVKFLLFSHFHEALAQVESPKRFRIKRPAFAESAMSTR